MFVINELLARRRCFSVWCDYSQTIQLAHRLKKSPVKLKLPTVSIKGPANEFIAGPVVTTLNRRDWKSFFGPQRTASLFKRIEHHGSIQYRLKSDFR